MVASAAAAVIRPRACRTINPATSRSADDVPAYVEFRIGDYQHELGLIDGRFAPSDRSNAAGGAMTYWAVDDVEAAFAQLVAMGATRHEDVTERGPGFATAAVVDPFGNILGVMFNQYYMDIAATRIDSDWTVGSNYALTHPSFPGTLMDGDNIEVDPPHRLVQTAVAHWRDEVEAIGPTRLTWEIEPIGDSCRLTLVHDQLPQDAPEDLTGGWPMILSGLKTLLETGEQLTTPGSLMYANEPEGRSGS